ncbi:hypothetical protein WA158_006184 [Blastocystis sp. Blastoise]
MSIVNSTPVKDSFFMPAEWSKHKQTWMGFPVRPDNWRCNAKYAQLNFADVANAIARFEPVTVCAPKEQFEYARSILDKNVRVIEMSQNDSWFRDTAPIFVMNKEGIVRGTDWEFNAWGGLEGGCYDDWSDDNSIPNKICNIERLERYKQQMILEGGSISVDGEGTLLTTEECLLNHNRNPSLTKQEIENNLKTMFNLKKVIWFPRGLYGDVDTNGHVDNFCVYVKPGEVVMAWTDDIQDPQYEICREAENVLKQEQDACGRYIKIHKLYIPTGLIRQKDEIDGIEEEEGTIGREEGQRLPGSYANFYFANDAVILPGYNMAKKIFEELFPEKTVVQIFTREILLGGGNIHCITQQQPEGHN